MITKEEIQRQAIFEQSLLIENSVEPLFSAGVRAGFEIGANWTIDKMMSELSSIEALRVTAVNENEKLRVALKVIFDADEKELRGEMWYAETVSDAITEAKNIFK